MKFHRRRDCQYLFGLLLSCIVPAPAATVTANYSSASEVPVTATAYTATGNTVDIALDFAPPAGTNLTVINNTGFDFIHGTFDNLAQGQAVNLTYAGIIYPFVADYFGGTGNDLVLQWANARLLAWGDNYQGKLGNNSSLSSHVPVPVHAAGVLAGKTITATAAGFAHSVALCSDGTLAAWGDNNFNQLGTGGGASPIPVAVDRSGVLAGKTVIAISARDQQSLALCSDGSLVAWGWNVGGRLGNNSTGQSDAPVAVDQSGVLAGRKVVAVSMGHEHALVLCSDGTMAAWGANNQGQLGTNSTTSSKVPVPVTQTGVLSGRKVIAISAGGSHNLALCSDGTLVAWGYNASGQLGNNSTSNRPVPTQVNQTGVLFRKAIVAVSAGVTRSLVLTADGALAAWGANVVGQLGNNSTTDSLIPVLVDRTGVLAGRTVTAIASGNYHSLAFCSDGTLATWGSNGAGQLGNNSTTFSSVPVLVDTGTLKPGERFTPRSTTAGDSHSLAVVVSPPAPVAATTTAATNISDTGATLGGSVNPNGTSTAVSFEFGTTTAYESSVEATPAIIGGTGTTAVSAVLADLLSGTTYHYRVVADSAGGVLKGEDMTFTTSALARLSGLTLSAGTLTPAFDPVITRYAVSMANAIDQLAVTPITAVPGATVTVNGSTVASGAASAPIDLSEGDNLITVVVTAPGGVTTGTYTVTATRLPRTFRFDSADETGATVANLVATDSTADFELNFPPPPGTTLKVINNTGLQPIGGSFENLSQGQTVTLGYGGIDYRFVANYFGGNGNDLVLQWANTRALSWGGDSAGDSPVPAPVNQTGILSGKTIIGLAAGRFFSLAVCTDGTVAAWGYNYYGQLGNNSKADSALPVAVDRSGVLAGKTVVAVAAGGEFSLALCADGTLATWGSNSSGQLGNNGGSTYPGTVPVAVDRTGVLAGRTVIAISAGAGHALVLCSDGTLATWGRNNDGQLGDNSTTDRRVPVAVDGTGTLAGKTVIAISAGGGHCLALCSDGTVAAWGRNSNGQLGDNGTTASRVPVAVTNSGALSGKTITALAAGAHHSLAVCSDGTVAAWGYNFSGQLGDGSNSRRPSPVAVDQTGVLAGKSVVAVAAGAEHTLALCADGTLTAWGEASSRQLGNNNSLDSKVPVLVNTDALRPGERFAAGNSGCAAVHSMALVASPPEPTATTVAAAGITDTGAILNGAVNANGSATGATFEYGLTGACGTTVTADPATLAGTAATPVTAALTGLLSGSTYHYRVVADSPGGVVKGADMTFTTSTVATLSGLALSTGTLDPDFAPVLVRYAATVPYATASITITPATAFSGASVTVNGIPVEPGGASAPLDLTEGENPFGIIVTAADGIITETYSVTVTRLPDAFRFDAADEVPLTVADFVATGIDARFELLFRPLPGTNLTVVNNTGERPITGSFANLAEGQTVGLEHDGITYPFIASYYGGTGNDLVLRWAQTRLVAWGANYAGQLGINSLNQSLTPVAVDRTGILAGKTIVGGAVSWNNSVALCSGGTLAAWGANAHGQLGNNGSTSDSLVPVAVDSSGVLSGKTVISLSGGTDHILALCSDGTLAAWGAGGFLGNGSTTDGRVPVLVDRTGALAGRTVIAACAGGRHGLALCSDGTLASWGDNSSGQLGNNSTHASQVPVLVDRTGVLAGRTVVAISGGTYHSLALCSDGTLAAWGGNSSGELGDDRFPNSPVPVMVDRTGVLAGKTVVAVSGGKSHSLALCSDGTLAAWGFASYLGNGSYSDSRVPMLVDQTGVLAGRTIITIAGAGDHALALCSDGTLAAWGPNNYGSLGTGGTTYSRSPVLVNTAELQAGERMVGVLSGPEARHCVALVASPPPPAAMTLPATGVSTTAATLNGSVYPNGSATTVSFEYGLTNAYGSSVAAAPSPVGGNAMTAVSGSISGLTAGATYHYRVVATNAGGTVRGEDLSFLADGIPVFADDLPSLIEANPAGDDIAIDLGRFASDPDPGDTLTWSITAVSNPNLFRTFELASDTGNLAVIYNPWQSGSSDVTVRVTDFFGGLAETVITFTLPSHPDPQLEVAATLVLNRQTGLYEHTITVTNSGAREVAGFDLTITGLVDGVCVNNASDCNGGTATVHHRQPLAAGAAVTLVVEYYAPVRGTVLEPRVAISLVTEPDSDPAAPDGGLAVDRCIRQADGSVLIEFTGTPGSLYEIHYSDGGENWKLSPVRVRAAGNRVQWIDRGPPRTDSAPITESCRFYRVRETTTP